MMSLVMCDRFQVRIREPARRAIERLDHSVKIRIRKALEKLSNTPYLGKPLSGPLSGYWSYRVGNYRIIYRIEEKHLIVYVFGIGHRREIYKSLKSILDQLRLPKRSDL
jgi:mRNA interferase RelE/StbE